LIPGTPFPSPQTAFTVREGGLCSLGVPLVLADSVTESGPQHRGTVVVTGSHAGLSVVRYAVATAPLLAVFNDAGVGKDGAGIAALPLLEAAGVAACAVAHTSARIGEAASTLADGRIVHANAQARRLGATPGRVLGPWLLAPPKRR
jgi:hypothetical protein